MTFTEIGRNDHDGGQIDDFVRHPNVTIVGAKTVYEYSSTADGTAILLRYIRPTERNGR